MNPKSKPRILIALSVLLLINIGLVQLTADEKTEAEIPEKAVCTVCASHGAHGNAKVEEVKAWSQYMDKMHYFCSEECKNQFDADPQAYIPPVLPRPLPEFVLENLKGKKATLKKHKGKVILLDFWATWCEPCVKGIPELKKLHEELGKGEKFTIVGISVDVGKDARKKVQKFVKKQKISYPILRDAKKGQASLALKVKAIPAMFLIDQKGQIVAQWVGEVDKNEVREKIAEFLSDAFSSPQSEH